jgi:hypothetical protein
VFERLLEAFPKEDDDFVGSEYRLRWTFPVDRDFSLMMMSILSRPSNLARNVCPILPLDPSVVDVS